MRNWDNMSHIWWLTMSAWYWLQSSQTRMVRSSLLNLPTSSWSSMRCPLSSRSPSISHPRTVATPNYAQLSKIRYYYEGFKMTNLLRKRCIIVHMSWRSHRNQKAHVIFTQTVPLLFDILAMKGQEINDVYINWNPQQFRTGRSSEFSHQHARRKASAPRASGDPPRPAWIPSMVAPCEPLNDANQEMVAIKLSIAEPSRKVSWSIGIGWWLQALQSILHILELIILSMIINSLLK